MKSCLFTLVNAEDRHEVVAWGMEITYAEPGSGAEHRVATTFVPDLTGNHQDAQGKHASAEAARNFFEHVLPVEVDVIRQEFPGSGEELRLWWCRGSAE